VLAKAAEYGSRYSPAGPPLDATRYVFPMTPPGDYVNGHHDYPANDIFTSIGTPVVACVRAEVLRTSPVETGKGGITVTLRGEDGWRYYYAHLAVLDPAIRPGVVVEAGTRLGLSGNTGNARTTEPHLHFGISKTGSVAGEINPYPYLRLWEGDHAPIT
jgi:murein DD-endopeptidase MepM/ murein hydrolase activator NlpD